MLATEILTEDHNNVLSLIDELKDRRNNESGNRNIFSEIDLALRTHMRVEEEIFYPALEENADFSGLMAESVPEHNDVRDFLDRLEAINNPANAEFQRMLDELRDNVRQHAEKEEADIFPRSLAVVGPDRIEELGNQIDQMKAEAGMVRTANM